MSRPDHRPLALVRALRTQRPALTGPQIDDRLIEIEQSLQRRLSVSDVAKLTGEKPATIYKAIARGQLNASTTPGSNMRQVDLVDAEAWAQRPQRQQDEAA